MQDAFKKFRGGVKFINLSTPKGSGLRTAKSESEAEKAKDSLGLLYPLMGTWQGEDNDGWNIISIPSKTGFRFEVVPYSEVLKFNSEVLVGADNVGPVLNGEPTTQQLVGLMYEQIIKSSCVNITLDDTQGRKVPDGFTRKCKFKYGDVIHAETGFFLNINDFSSGLNLTRLATIPHGNSVLQLGKVSITNTPITDSSFIDEVSASVAPTRLDGSKITVLGYADTIETPQFPDIPGFHQENPNSALHNGLTYQTEAGTKNKTILEMTTLELSTEFAKAGILNIPFLQSNVDTTKMTTTFWIQKIKGDSESLNDSDKKDYWQLQYTQTIDLVFPVPTNPTPIIWPHVTVNTLRKVSDTTVK